MPLHLSLVHSARSMVHHMVRLAGCAEACSCPCCQAAAHAQLPTFAPTDTHTACPCVQGFVCSGSDPPGSQQHPQLVHRSMWGRGHCRCSLQLCPRGSSCSSGRRAACGRGRGTHHQWGTHRCVPGGVHKHTRTHPAAADSAAAAGQLPCLASPRSRQLGNQLRTCLLKASSVLVQINSCGCHNIHEVQTDDASCILPLGGAP
jgi:hypothetical protein